MSSIESGRRALSLKELGQREAAAPPPYGYEEFLRRHGRSVARRRTTGWAAAASVAALGVIIGLALRDAPTAGMAGQVAAGFAADEVAADMFEPVLVNAGHLALRDELEGRIAWFDDALSAGHADELPAVDRLQLQHTRDEMARSLQHVVYAHALLDF